MPKNEIEAAALEQLNEQCFTWDTEMCHRIADDILCDVLKDLGYDELVARYKKVNKWYV
jgi:hypothetical protein